MSENCKESLMEMYKSFKPEVAGGLKATYCFDISGPTGGKWTLDIQEGKCELKEGHESNPSVTISMNNM